MRAFSRPPNLKQHKTDTTARKGGFFSNFFLLKINIKVLKAK